MEGVVLLKMAIVAFTGQELVSQKLMIPNGLQHSSVVDQWL